MRWSGIGLIIVGTLLSVLTARTAAPRIQVAPASPALRALAESLALGAPGTLDRFWRTVEQGSTPLVEQHPHPDSSRVTFLYRGAPGIRTVRLTSGLNALLIKGAGPDFGATGSMRRLPGTDVWYVSVVAPRDLRVSYGFKVVRSGSDSAEGNILDPLNPRVYRPDREALRASLLELPDAPAQPWHGREEGGSWRTGRIADSRGQENDVFVYLPASFDSGRAQPYPVLIGLDSYSFGIGMPGALVMDHLIATGSIPPTVMVAANVPRANGLEQLELTAAYVAEALLPQLRGGLNLTSDPRRIVVSGTSRRGLIAAFIGFTRSDVIGNVLSLSGSFYWKPDNATEYEWLARRFATEAVRPLRLFVAAGTLETVVTPTNHGHYMVGTSRHLRDVLLARDYDVTYWEFGGDHSYLNWQDGLARGLVVLLGKGPAAR